MPIMRTTTNSSIRVNPAVAVRPLMLVASFWKVVVQNLLLRNGEIPYRNLTEWRLFGVAARPLVVRPSSRSVFIRDPLFIKLRVILEGFCPVSVVFRFINNNRSCTTTFQDDDKNKVFINPFIFFSLFRPLYLSKTAFYTRFYTADTSGYGHRNLSKF